MRVTWPRRILIIKYRQCSLRRAISTGFTVIVTYIPSKFANVGSYVKIKEGDRWTNGWLVESAGSPIEEEMLPDSHSDIKGHRIMTGDSLRKQS